MNSSEESNDIVPANPTVAPAAPVEAAPAPASVEATAPIAAARDSAAPEPAPRIDSAPAIAQAAATPPPSKPAPEVKSDVQPPSGAVIPFIASPRSEAPSAPAAASGAFWRVVLDRRVQFGALAAALALVGVVAVSSISYGNQQAHSLEAQAAEAQTIEDAVKTLKARIAVLESARRDEAADLRKAATELKTGVAGSRDVSASLAQLSARFDRLEHDQDARIEKLGERIDHDATTRNTDAAAHSADIAARLEKLEKKVAAPVVASLALPSVAPAAPPPKPPTLTPAPAPTPTPIAPVFGAGVSRETTGSISPAPAPARPVIRSWIVREVHDGVAVVEGPYGYREIGPGEYLPGAGRVERIERRGNDWQVVTSQGMINGAPVGNF
jgi:hypothetical protein